MYTTAIDEHRIADAMSTKPFKSQVEAETKQLTEMLVQLTEIASNEATHSELAALVSSTGREAKDLTFAEFLALNEKRKALHSADLDPGRALYSKVRGHFMIQDTTLSKWCKQKGIALQTAIDVLTGSRNGPKAKALRLEIIEASGMNNNSSDDAA